MDGDGIGQWLSRYVQVDVQIEMEEKIEPTHQSLHVMMLGEGGPQEDDAFD